METVGREGQSGKAPGRQDGPHRIRSGEGARSAMEQLIQQRDTRDAQVPRDPSTEAAQPPRRPD